MDDIKWVRDEWLYVRMDKSSNGPAQARHFFNATADARVEETKDGYRVESAKCYPGAANDAD